MNKKLRTLIALFFCNIYVWCFANPTGHPHWFIMIAPDADKATANAAGTAWDLTVPSNASGIYTNTHTHWYGCFYATAAMKTEAEGVTNSNPNTKLFDATTTDIDAALATLGLVVITKDVPGVANSY